MAIFTRAAPVADPLATACGFISWNMHPALAAVALTPTSQTVYAAALWLPAGKKVSNINLGVTVVAAGTAPTGMYVGMCSQSQVVAQSANLASNTGWTSSGVKAFPLAASYTPTVSGIYYAFFLQNGTFGTTQPQLMERSTDGIASDTYKLWGTIGTGKSTPDANGTAITVTINQVCLFVAAS